MRVMRITDSLLAEHGILKLTLDYIAESITQPKELAEIKAYAGLLERLLRAHGEAEEQFIMSSLDHVLEEKGQRNQLHQVHLEIDVRMKEVQSAIDAAAARRLLRGAINTTRKHFRHEEQVIFPRCEKLLTADALETLGRAMSEHRHPNTADE